MMRHIMLFLLLLSPAISMSQTYSGISFYVVAHQEDWQCFMGRNAWNEMHMSQKKVVVINITAGNWNTVYLPGCCRVDCDSFAVKDSSYYFATESAERKSIDLAASAVRSICTNINSPYNFTSGKTSVGKTGERTIKGSHIHNVAVYSNNNVVCYFLRLDEQALSSYYSSGSGGIFAADGSTVYTDFDDLTKTVAGIYQYELLHDIDDAHDGPYINTFDDNLSNNPMDHIMHYYAKTIAYAACGQYKHCPKVRWSFNLYEGLHLKDEIPNLSAADETPEIQAKAALYAAWCIGMLNNNAQVDWGYFPTPGYSGTDFQDKEYSVHFDEEMGRCKAHSTGAADEKKRIDSYPNPVDDRLTVEFDTSINDGFIRITDLNGSQAYARTGITEARCYDIKTSAFAQGPYILTAGGSDGLLYKTLIIVHH